jgi:hypothetical protein
VRFRSGEVPFAGWGSLTTIAVAGLPMHVQRFTSHNSVGYAHRGAVWSENTSMSMCISTRDTCAVATGG